MSKPIVIGLGEYLWDMLPSGKKVGGAPVNFAYHASRHGTQGWAITAIGDDELGKELVSEAVCHGINLSASKVDYPTGTVKVTLKNGQPDYEICQGVAWDHIPVTDESLELCRKASAISFGTLAQRNAVSRKSIATLIDAAPKDCLIIFDINLRQNFYSREIIEDSLKRSDVFKINDDELKVVCSMLGMAGLSADDVCHSLIDKYDLKMLILTAGDRFSSVYTRETVSTIQTPAVDVVDAVGAGDAFTGAFVGSILCGKTIAEAHADAVDAAAFVCTQAGAWTSPAL